MNLAYVIPDTSITLSIGGRYQYLIKLEDNTKNQFYGVMVTTIYSFNI